MILQVRRHVGVVLDGVQIDPGLREFAGARSRKSGWCMCHSSTRRKRVLGRHQRVMKTFWPSISGVIKRDAALAHVEALAVLLRIEAGGEALRQYAAPVDHAAAQLHVTIDHHIGQDNRILDLAEAVHAHVGKQQRAAHASSR